MVAREKAIEMIQKLIRLQESPNENEAALAAAKASELMTKYHLEMKDVSELGDAAKMDEEASSHRFPSMQQWFLILANGVAGHFYCKMYYVKEYGELKSKKHSAKRGRTHGWYNRFRFYGRKSNAEVAAYMYDQLYNRLEELSLKAVKEYSKKYKSTSKELRSFMMDDPRSYRLAWLVGAAISVNRKLKEVREELLKESQTRAIILVMDKEVEDAWVAFSNDMRHKKSPKGPRSGVGYSDGLRDGKNIEIHHGLKGN